ncbi:hypothetical protein HK101_000701 [Irineochytrium annulatum]|nr:hypothetical protein HK101_000701 [Irineochytrium annulatum]
MSEGEMDSWGGGESEIAIAKWVYHHGQIAEEQIHGVLAVSMDAGESHEQQEQLRLLEACGGLAAGAIARVKLAEEARLAQITAESERIRTALLDSVSHELRTPLTAIIGSATGLLENDTLFTPEDRRELTGNIRDGALRMNRLVTNLLGMVRLESGMLQLNRKCPHRNIQVELPDDPAFIYGDEVLLEQVLVNIVSNAIKYSPDESQIVIIVTSNKSPIQLTIRNSPWRPTDRGFPIQNKERLKNKMNAPLGARILVIDDEPQIRKLLKVTLQAHQFELHECGEGAEGVIQASIVHPDLIILDLGLPGMSGMEVLRRIREWSQVPIIVLTAKDQEGDKIAALDGGADDYVTKPFGMGELVARIRVALRHVAKTTDEPILRFGSLTIDLAQRQVELEGTLVKLTPTEYEMLKVLASNAGKIITQRQLLQQVWGGHHHESDSHYLRVYVGHLRKKLNEDPTKPRYIQTEPGIGYRFLLPAE